MVRAYGGTEAIVLAQRLRPDLILLDLMMPDVNGFDVVDALQRDADTARIPILVVTAKHDHRGATVLCSTANRDSVVYIVDKAGFNRHGVHGRGATRVAAALGGEPDGQDPDRRGQRGQHEVGDAAAHAMPVTPCCARSTPRPA